MRRVIVPRAWQASLLRERSGDQRVTSIELFFDLVYVFAVTQLSHHLLGNPTVEGALETALLLVLVWLAWVYTTWVTNWLDPERIVVRLMLVALMLVSLVMSAALPAAFTTRGLAVGGAYATMQVGRSAFVVVALSGQRLQRNFERILAWCLLSGALAVAGGIAHGHTRELLWLLAAGVDLLGGAAGFYTPGLGRSATSEWTIEGGHFAERCQGFVIIALGESIVVIGAALSQLPSVTPAVVAAFAAAFAGSVASWWVYFDRSADEAARVIAASADPAGWAGRPITPSTRSWSRESSSAPRPTRRCSPTPLAFRPRRQSGWSSEARHFFSPDMRHSRPSSGASHPGPGWRRSRCSRCSQYLRRTCQGRRLRHARPRLS